MTEPGGAIFAYAITSELTRLRARVRELEAALRRADQALHLCAAQAGTPDPADGCRLIIATSDRAREAARRAMIDSPAPAPPADVTRALARLFKRFWDQDGGISAGEWSDWLCELKLCDWQVEGNRPVLSTLGEAALSVAEGE